MKKGFFSNTSKAVPTKSKPAPAPPPSLPSTSAPATLPTSIFPTNPSHNSITTIHWCFTPGSFEVELPRPSCALCISQESKLELFSSSRSFPLPPLTSYEGKKWDVVDITGKGKGLVAKMNIEVGETVLEDRPFLVWDQERGPTAVSRANADKVFAHALTYLEPSSQEAYDSLFNAFPSSSFPTLGKIETNSFPIVQFSNVTYNGTFPFFSRLNHSCDNNSLPQWDLEEFKVTVRAKRQIKKGEEITACYIVPFQKRRERREELAIKWKFECQCEWCSLSDEESAKKDIEREEMAKKFLAQWDSWTNK